MHPGGRSIRRLAALVVALLLLLGACGGSDADVASDRDQPTEGGREGRGGDEDDEDEVAAVTTSSTTTTSTTTTTTTTTVPPTTAPTTTAPPPPPTTEAPPPPPPPPPPPTTAAPAPSGVRNGTRNRGCEQYMHSQINAARANVGRSALSFDTGIQHIALAWSDEMSGSQTLRHNPSYGDQIVRHRDYRTAGENVGRGYEQGTLFQAFMNSPGHRANIESGAYSHVTVGCLTDPGGQLWVTQNFWGS